jgi:hypothetical protein
VKTSKRNAGGQHATGDRRPLIADSSCCGCRLSIPRWYRVATAVTRAKNAQHRHDQTASRPIPATDPLAEPKALGPRAHDGPPRSPSATPAYFVRSGPHNGAINRHERAGPKNRCTDSLISSYDHDGRPSRVHHVPLSGSRSPSATASWLGRRGKCQTVRIDGSTQGGTRSDAPICL